MKVNASSSQSFILIRVEVELNLIEYERKRIFFDNRS